MTDTKLASYLAKDRRKKVLTVIKELLTERGDLLKSYYHLSSFKESDKDGSMNIQVTKFCQILMDYAALGHFEIFDRIRDGNERRELVKQTADILYPKIEKSTAAFVAFNDKYAGDQEIELRHLIDDVSELGEAIDDRFDFEDQLLKAM
jgi:regulator of sigma D